MTTTKYLNEAISLKIIEINQDEYKLIINTSKGEFTHTHYNKTLLNQSKNKDEKINQKAIDILIGGVLFFNDQINNF
jgi:hypothetical protein